MGFESERQGNLLVRSNSLGPRVLNALHQPWFLLRPPLGYGIIETSGRKTGKTRRRCLRAVREGDKVYVVAIKGGVTGWAKNARADPKVRIRLRGGWFEGRAREVRADEAGDAKRIYCDQEVGTFEYAEYTMWRKGRPNPEKIRDLHRAWCAQGTPMVIELAP